VSASDHGGAGAPSWARAAASWWRSWRRGSMIVASRATSPGGPPAPPAPPPPAAPPPRLRRPSIGRIHSRQSALPRRALRGDDHPRARRLGRDVPRRLPALPAGGGESFVASEAWASAASHGEPAHSRNRWWSDCAATGRDVASRRTRRSSCSAAPSSMIRPVIGVARGVRRRIMAWSGHGRERGRAVLTRDPYPMGGGGTRTCSSAWIVSMGCSADGGKANLAMIDLMGTSARRGAVGSRAGTDPPRRPPFRRRGRRGDGALGAPGAATHRGRGDGRVTDTRISGTGRGPTGGCVSARSGGSSS
jgi:hypothetical protein